ncbi:zinc-binding metallopeptidase family protein [Zavarzinella formosa]|uniref:zinc-binding metallopeptidase family protein n=1 Tax=Zavarzinella formosa TaxID=360055 RepID=UPI000312C995|nr:putative zinc-binding peptidase [Zavarzinella formosa]
MKTDHCDHCGQVVFFENVQCVKCGHLLAFLPDEMQIGSLEEAEDGLWRKPDAKNNKARYRLCANYTEHQVCNWAVDSDDSNPLCISCRLTQVIPNLNEPGKKEAWYKLETAKRRLIYTLLALKLPITGRLEEPETGLSFEFLSDPEPGTPDAEPVLTGHDNGKIVINIAEADDSEREKRRHAMHEPYRTLLGHFRHEIGHYYWDQLIKDSPRLEAYRHLFGDERADYGEALQKHYKDGAPADWNERFISTYATAHPWEDWAESWAHYLHMSDALETASDCGLHLKPARSDEPKMKATAIPVGKQPDSFQVMVNNWYPLTYVLNNLNRGIGLPDGYPFVISPPVLDKLRFIHETISANANPVLRTKGLKAVRV